MQAGLEREAVWRDFIQWHFSAIWIPPQKGKTEKQKQRQILKDIPEMAEIHPWRIYIKTMLLYIAMNSDGTSINMIQG